jgi:deoxyadenosine/deoxycytidine kinase
MPTSKKRGGAKAHRKRVQKRNEQLGLMKKNFEKKYTQMLEEKFKEFQEKYSAETDTVEYDSIEIEDTKEGE